MASHDATPGPPTDMGPRHGAPRPKGGRAVRMSAAVWRAQAAEAARRGRRQTLLLAPLLAAVIVLYQFRRELFGLDEPIRIATAVALLLIGWGFARGLGRALGPRLMRDWDPATAGVVGFIVRLITLAAAVLVSLRLAGLSPATLAAGAGFTAIILGLAAQQTFGNVLAGLVLLSARPFQIGDRVRFAGFGMDVEGTVAAYGLLYVTMHDGEDLVLVPNNTALTMSIRPIREPSAVDLRARLPLAVDPEAVQERVTEAVSVATRADPHVILEEFDGAEVIVRVRATPANPAEGGRLAREVLDAVSRVGRPEPDGRRRHEPSRVSGEGPGG